MTTNGGECVHEFVIATLTEVEEGARTQGFIELAARSEGHKSIIELLDCEQLGPFAPARRVA